MMIPASKRVQKVKPDFLVRMNHLIQCLMFYSLLLLPPGLLFAENSKGALIEFKEAFDLKKLPTAFKSQKERGAKVAELLEAHLKNQIQKLPALSNEGIESVTPLWIVNSVVVKGTPAAISKILKEQSWGPIQSIEPERTMKVEGLEDLGTTFFPPNTWGPTLGWGVERIRAPEAWNGKADLIGAAGKGIIVAVIDSGVNIQHPDLSLNVWTNPNETAGNLKDDDGNGYVDDLHGWNFENNNNEIGDYHGHGTQAAGIVVGAGLLGTQTGVAPKASLMVLRACCSLTGEISEAAMWSAMQYAIKNGAHVISQSLTVKHFSSPSYTKWRKASEVALLANMVHINSAGNRGSGNEPYNIGAPASNPAAWYTEVQMKTQRLSSMITVGAVNQDDLLRAYSSVGPVTWSGIMDFNDFPYDGEKKLGLMKPDVCAPSEVPSTSKDGGSYTPRFGGTSSATPHVAGIAALLLSSRPYLTVAQLTEAIEVSAVPIGDRFNNKCGAGRVDAYAALQYLSKFK